MNWYLTKIIFRIICGDGHHTPQFDEQLRLVWAGDDKEAFIKAQEIGKNESVSFYNHRQQMVEWKFVDVCELYKITEMIDGAELYSRVQETNDAEEYIELVRKRANFIQNNPIAGFISLYQ
ncbi:MAG: DUF4288 domain-containing protein [Chitinophagaceae bacterium]